MRQKGKLWAVGKRQASSCARYATTGQLLLAWPLQ